MRTGITLIANNLKNLIVKEPIYSIAFLIIPILISILLSNVLASEQLFYHIGVIDQDQSVYSEKLMNGLEAYDEFSVVKMEEEDALNKMKLGEVDAVITLPKDFLSSSMEMLTGDDKGLVDILERVIQSEMAYINVLEQSSASGGDPLQEKTISYYNLKKTNYNYSNSLSILSFVIMFLFLRAVNGAMLITQDKDQNIYLRILVSRVNRFKYYLANFISTFLLLFIQGFFTIGVLQYLFHVDFGVGLVDLTLVFSAISLFLVSIVILLEVTIKNREVLNLLNTFIMILLLLLGGGLVPIQYMPNSLDFISKLTPLRWAIEAIDKLQNGMEFRSIEMDLVGIALSSIIIFAFSIFIESRKDAIK